MADDTTLKSSYELAMERLKKGDADAGIAWAPLSEGQKAAIAEIRSFYKAKLAELEILHQGKIRATPDHAARELVEEEYRRDRERLSSERDTKVDKARQASG